MPAPSTAPPKNIAVDAREVARLGRGLGVAARTAIGERVPPRVGAVAEHDDDGERGGEEHRAAATARGPRAARGPGRRRSGARRRTGRPPGRAAGWRAGGGGTSGRRRRLLGRSRGRLPHRSQSNVSPADRGAGVVTGVHEPRPVPEVPMDRVRPLSDAVAEHVHAGDALHLVVGHTRWTRGGARGRAAVVGPRSRLHAGDAQPVEPRRAVLPGRPRAQGDHRLLGRHVPELHAEPVVRAGVPGRARSRSSTGRSSRSRSGSRPRRAGCPRSTTRSIAGSSMEANDGVRAGRHAVRRGRPARAARARRRARCTRRSPTAPGNVAVAPAAARRRVGRARGAPRARSSPSSGSSTTCGRGRTSCASPRTGCSRCARRRWARTPAGCTPATCPVDGYGEDYDFWVDGARRDPRRRLRRRGSAHWVLDVDDPGRSTSTGSATSASRALRAKAEPDSWQRRRGARTRPTSTRPPNAWERAAVVGRAPPRRAGASRSTRDAVLAGAGVANLAAWLGVAARARAGERRAAHRRDRAVGLRRRRPPTRSCSTTATSRRDDARRRGDGARRARRRPRHARRSACLGGAQVDRLGNINSTLIPDGPFLVGSGGGNDVASVAAECVVVATLDAAAHADRVRLHHVARPRGARARHRPRHAREARRTASSCSPRCPPGDEPLADADRARPAPRAAGTSRSRRRSRELAAADRPTRSPRCGAGTPAAGSSARDATS